MLMTSLVGQNFENFAMLVQIVRQNLQSPESSECMTLILEKGFQALLEVLLDDFMPIGLDPQDIIDLERAPGAILSLAARLQPGTEPIQPQIKFFQTRKHRILLIDVLMSLLIIKKPTMWELFFGPEQEARQFGLFKKLAFWQVLSVDSRERKMLDQVVSLLLFDSLPEAIIINKTSVFGMSRRAARNPRNGVLHEALLGRGDQPRRRFQRVLLSNPVFIVHAPFVPNFRPEQPAGPVRAGLPAATHGHRTQELLEPVRVDEGLRHDDDRLGQAHSAGLASAAESASEDIHPVPDDFSAGALG